MSRFHSLDRALAHDDNFREFFTNLTGGTSGLDLLNTTSLLHAIDSMHTSPSLAPAASAPVMSPSPTSDGSGSSAVAAQVASLPLVTSSALAVEAPAASNAAPVTISADFDTANTDAGPYWVMNSVWNKGNLVNGTTDRYDTSTARST